MFFGATSASFFASLLLPASVSVLSASDLPRPYTFKARGTRWTTAFLSRRLPMIDLFFSACSTALSSNGRPFNSFSVGRCSHGVNGDVTTTSSYVGCPPTSRIDATAAFTLISGSYPLMNCSVSTLSLQLFRRTAHQSQMWLWPQVLASFAHSWA